MGLSEQVQDDPMAMLRRAREIIAASVCRDFPLSYTWLTREIQDPGVPARPPKSRKMDKSTRDDRIEQQKQLPPLIREDRPTAPFIPSSLRRRHDSGEEDPPLEHRLRSANPGDKGVYPFKTQEQFTHVDNKVSEACNSNTTSDC